MSREELKQLNEVVKQRLHYHFLKTDGEWDVPKDMPFMKEFLNEMKRLCAGADQLLSKEGEISGENFGITEEPCLCSCVNHWGCECYETGRCKDCGKKVTPTNR